MEKLTKQQKAVLNLLSGDVPFTTTEISYKLNTTYEAEAARLKKLKARNLVERIDNTWKLTFTGKRVVKEMTDA